MELEATSYRPSGLDLPPAHEVDLEKVKGTVHFIGIGGIGMSALARLLIARGVAVSGSDKDLSATTRQLAELGAHVHAGHQKSHIAGVGAVVVSTAITDDNPELKEARKLGLPVWHRSDVLAYLSDKKKLVAISGTHGKTTTTGMVAQVLLDAGVEPTVVVGGIFGKIDANSISGNGEYFVAETDESDGTHAHASSYLAVITNIEADHLENYPGGIEEIRSQMLAFANLSKKAVVLCQDDEGCRSIAPKITAPVVTYGSASQSAAAHYTYENLPGFGLRIFKGGQSLGDIQLSVPGEHNKINALAASVVALELGLTFEDVKRGLEDFAGVNRRFQILGSEGGVTVVDDYAHHPTEVAATLSAATEFRQARLKGQGRIVALFQPHQPGRLQSLWGEFCQSFSLADLVLISDIYVARGKPIEGVTSELFAQAIKHANVRYLPGTTQDLPAQVLAHILPQDLLITIGAGDITKVGFELLQLLKQGHCHGTVR